MPLIYLAPLQGITDRIYRNLFAAYFSGVDGAIAPFLSPQKRMKPDHRQVREVLPEENPGLPTVPQILTADAGDFVRLANWLFDLGCPVVNWNLGCPFRVVVKKGKGSGLLPHPDRVAAFLDEALPALKPGLSIKLRLGLSRTDEILALLPLFDRYPLTELIIHPRTGVQMYEGKADEDAFAACLPLTRHPVVYNGDIDSPETLAQLSRRFGTVERWMIGRGLIGNPFLAQEIKGEAARPYGEKVQVLKAFHDHLFAEYEKVLCGPAHIVNKMKEIWAYLAAFFAEEAKVQKRIRKTHHRDHYLTVVAQIFSEAGHEHRRP